MTVFIQLLLHLRLINATCVKYTDRVLPHVSTPYRLNIITYEKISPAFLHLAGSGEGLGTRLFCLTCIVYEWDAEQIKLCTHIQLPGSELGEHEEGNVL